GDDGSALQSLDVSADSTVRRAFLRADDSCGSAACGAGTAAGDVRGYGADCAVRTVSRATIFGGYYRGCHHDGRWPGADGDHLRPDWHAGVGTFSNASSLHRQFVCIQHGGDSGRVACALYRHMAGEE